MTDHYEAVLDGHAAITSVTGPNETVGDWFEYVWSTTRGIRKDLTQQDMTSLTAVDLVINFICSLQHFCFRKLAILHPLLRCQL